jgi:hypothetical protein
MRTQVHKRPKGHSLFSQPSWLPAAAQQAERICKMKFAFFVVLLGILYSCNDENMDYSIGSRFVHPKSDVRYFDSTTVHSFTVLLDSLPTSGTEQPVMWVGEYHDEAIGDIRARTFFRVGLPPSLNVPADATFDSLVLILHYNRTSYGDTNALCSIQVHRLTESLNRDQSYFFNTSAPAYDPLPLGSVTLTPTPMVSDTLRIRLENNLGTELFTFLKDKNDIIKERELFYNYLQGFVLSGDNNRSALSFTFPTLKQVYNSSAYFPAMRLYYHYFDNQTEYKYVDFNIDDESEVKQFNQFALIHPEEAFPDNQGLKLSASLTHNMTYVQAGTGLVTRLEIPYLKTLLHDHQYVVVLKALLRIEPVYNTYDQYKPPKWLTLSLTNKLNNFDLSYKIDGQLHLDDEFKEDTYYTFDITQQVANTLAGPSDEPLSFLLSVPPQDLYLSLNRVVLGSQWHEENRISLKIYYVDSEEYE